MLCRCRHNGYKAQVVDNAAGLVVDYSVHIGNPSDTDLLRPAIERIVTRLGAPTMVTADRGYWDTTIETDLGQAGVTAVMIPRTGKPSAARHDRTRGAVHRGSEMAHRQRRTHLRSEA